MVRPRLLVVLASSSLLAACSSPSAPSAEGPAAAGPLVAVLDDASGSAGFWSRPFPDETRRKGGAIDLADFPSPTHADIEARVLALVQRDADGFGLTSGIFFPLGGAIDAAKLPDLASSAKDGAPVFVVDVDPASPERGRRMPVKADFREDGGPFGAPNLLSLLPVQGIPLHRTRRYAAVVLRALGDAGGAPLAPLTDEQRARHADGLADLAAVGVPADAVAGLTVFTTGDPTAGYAAVVAQAFASPPPALLAPLAKDETFDDYCVYHSTVKMPVWQRGTPPFATDGGDWAFDASGAPVLQGEEEARLVLTVPRTAVPASGFPLVVLSRTGAGGERPLVDRGVQATHGGPALVPGSGPAMEYARAGWAGLSIDGPHGGLRNVTHADEQFLMFNVSNPAAMRDNVRQSAVELALAAHVVDGIAFDASDCPGVTGTVKIDPGRLALMGHSMGATIAPLTLAFEPRYGGALLSGAGGSYIENVLWKQSPINVRPVAEALLGVTSLGWRLHEHDPMLSMLQWALEPSDPPVYGDRVIDAPETGSAHKHVLMMQGVVDTYILPPIADAVSLSLGLDVGGMPLDATAPALAKFTPLAELLPLVGRGVVALPASGNRGWSGPLDEHDSGLVGAVTGVVVQYPEDGVEDGHEVVFQTEAPKRAYRCFLAGLARGEPPTVLPRDGEATCP